MLSTFVDPLGEKLDHPGATRATLIGALLIGIAILREVLHSPGLTDVDPANLERLVTRAIDELVQTSTKKAT
jgi:hypothetical protein